MDVIKSGNKVLFVWGGKVNEDLEKIVNELKKITETISVENIDRLLMGMHLTPTHVFI